MSSNNNHKRIAVLFKEEVRTFGENNIAGCERVFFEDVTYLKSIGLLTRAYMAARNVSEDKKKTSIIHRIPYPHHLLDKLLSLLEWTPIFKRPVNIFYKISKLLIQLWYAGVFIITEFKTEAYYVVQVPLVALFFPKKTTLFYHNFYLDLDLMFKILYLFKKRAKDIKFAFVSESLLAQYKKKYPIITQSKCYILPNSVDLKRFAPAKKEKDKITFTYLSAWVEEKGVYLLPKIIEEINFKYKDKVSFVIGGSVNLWSLSDKDTKKYIDIENKILKLADKFQNVKILGLVDRGKVPNILSTSTFLLLPSIWQEPNSLLIKESLSCGTPVVAFDVGGNGEMITNDINGYLINGKNCNSLIKRMDIIINKFNWGEYIGMSKNSRKGSELYSPQTRNTKLLKILLDCK